MNHCGPVQTGAASYDNIELHFISTSYFMGRAIYLQFRALVPETEKHFGRHSGFLTGICRCYRSGVSAVFSFLVTPALPLRSQHLHILNI